MLWSPGITASNDDLTHKLKPRRQHDKTLKFGLREYVWRTGTSSLRLGCQISKGHVTMVGLRFLLHSSVWGRVTRFREAPVGRSLIDMAPLSVDERATLMLTTRRYGRCQLCLRIVRGPKLHCISYLNTVEAVISLHLIVDINEVVLYETCI